MTKFGRDQFAAATSVSRETLDRLESLVGLLESWQAKINLISRDSLGDVWRRHLFDSAQLVPLIPNTSKTVADLGSGAGFPGLVLALLGVPGVILVESDERKCLFLREALRVTETRAEVRRGRIENLAPMGADVVTARALAPLSRLLPLAARHLTADGICLLLKGAGVGSELTATREFWHTNVDIIRSRSNPSGKILRIGGISRVDGGKHSGI